MKFKYQARTAEGEIKTGEIEAFSKEAAIDILQRSGLYPTFIEEAKVAFYFPEIPFFKKISTRELVIATREIAVMVRSGVPIVEALNAIAKESKNPNVKEIFSNLAKEIEGGSTLSDALSRYPQVFSKTFVALVKSGEASGELPKTLEQLAETLERNYHLSARIRGALIYPGLILGLSILVFLFMLFYLVPRLFTFVLAMEAKIPVILLFALKFSEFFKKWWLTILILFAGFVTSLIVYSKTKEGKNILDRISLKMPLIGEFLKLTYLTRIGENLATLISSGVPIAQSLEITEGIVGNIIYQEILQTAKNAVKAGESLSSAFKDHPIYFPDFFAQMIVAGEKTGTLSKSLLQISDFYQKELERKVNNLTELITPVLLILMGFVVGVLIITILTTIYSTIRSIM
jgi:type IV pilus assembly protein PilC